MLRTPKPHGRRAFTAARVIALALIGLTTLGLLWLGLRGEPALTVPAGAEAGNLTMTPCTFDTEAGPRPADCGTLAVPENRNDAGSRLIGLPVIRVRATGPEPAEPIFRLGGGPGATNLEFPQADRLTDRHDVVLVGYRGVDGSSVLDCPEVDQALRTSADLVATESFRSYADAFATCSRRLTADGVDLDGYSLTQRVDDLEAVRTALGYERVNLFSSSAGTRTAMIYSWRYPASLLRSVMVGANPPGHFVWDPEITDRQLAHFAQLCEQDETCGPRTDDLAASMRRTAADLPDRWGPLRIKPGNVRAGTQLGLFQTTSGAAPLNAPTMVDSWLRAADGDRGGLWAMSVFADLAFPGSFVWGEFAATGMIDAPEIDRYYASGGDPGSILGNAAGDLLMGGGALTRAWPANPDDQQYRNLRPTDVETLLVNGTLDVTTPAELAAEDLLPSLRNGHHVKLADLGHTPDFWDYQPDAGKHLLSSFYDRGVVDGSRYRLQKVDFEVGAATMATIGRALLGLVTGGALIAVALLAWMVRRLRRKGAVGARTGAVLRVVAPLFLGLGAWFLAVLVVWTVLPTAFIGSALVAVPPMGVAVGLGCYVAWVHRDWSPAVRHRGLAAALAGALVGAWLGFGAMAGVAAVLTTIAGAAAGANLALLTLDLTTTGTRPHAP